MNLGMDRTAIQPIVCSYCSLAGHPASRCEERRHDEHKAREAERKAHPPKPVRRPHLKPLAA